VYLYVVGLLVGGVGCCGITCVLLMSPEFSGLTDGQNCIRKHRPRSLFSAGFYLFLERLFRLSCRRFCYEVRPCGACVLC
jgi:hypothetical protein